MASIRQSGFRTTLSTQGFTLIEMSVVLVIVGLIAAGILVGQSMVKSAAERSEIAMFEQYNSAGNAFVYKYGQLPGDFNKATTYFPNPPSTILVYNGNNDGYINSFWTNGPGNVEQYVVNTTEMAQFFAHLYLAGMIPFQPNTTNNGSATAVQLFPPSHIRGYDAVYSNFYNGSGSNGFVIATANQKHAIATGIDLNTTDYDSVISSTYPWDAITSFDIDKKIDDGMPQTGSIHALCWDHVWGKLVYDAQPGQLCRVSTGLPCVTSAGVYDIVNNPQDCGLRVDLSF